MHIRTVDVRKPNVQFHKPNTFVFSYRTFRFRTFRPFSSFGGSVFIFFTKLDHFIYKTFLLQLKRSSIVDCPKTKGLKSEQNGSYFRHCLKSKPFGNGTTLESAENGTLTVCLFFWCLVFTCTASVCYESVSGLMNSPHP